MKKELFFLGLICAIFLTGCGDTAETEAMADAFERMNREYSTVICNVLSKEWTEIQSDEIYLFTKEGEGTISGQSFSYYCGFDEKNQILLKIVMDETMEEDYYYVSVDETGYGLYLDGPGKDQDLYLMQSNVEVLNLADERAEGVLGEWKDQNDHRYIFRENGTMTVKGSAGDSDGTFSTVRWKEDGSLRLMLVTGSNAMDFQYEFSDADTLQLCRPGEETVHTWVRVK